MSDKFTLLVDKKTREVNRSVSRKMYDLKKKVEEVDSRSGFIHMPELMS